MGRKCCWRAGSARARARGPRRRMQVSRRDSGHMCRAVVLPLFSEVPSKSLLRKCDVAGRAGAPVGQTCGMRAKKQSRLTKLAIPRPVSSRPLSHTSLECPPSETNAVKAVGCDGGRVQGGRLYCRETTDRRPASGVEQRPRRPRAPDGLNTANQRGRGGKDVDE